MQPLVAVSVAVTAVLVAGCGGSQRRVSQPDRLARNRAAALAAARETIGHLALPAGAVLVSHEPTGDHGMLAPGLLKDPRLAHVTLNSWWTVHASVSQVLRFVTEHPMAGSLQNMSGSSRISQPRASSHWVDSYWPAPGNGIASRRLQVTATRLADGETGVMASADVVWVVPRPASEVVPSGVGRVVVVLVRPRPGGKAGPAVRVTLNGTSPVRRAIRLVDSLGAEQPSKLQCVELPITYRCPADRAGTGSLTVSFRANPSRAALATASVGIPADWAYTGVDGDPIRFSIHGHPAQPLSGASFVTHILALAGLHSR